MTRPLFSGLIPIAKIMGIPFLVVAACVTLLSTGCVPEVNEPEPTDISRSKSNLEQIGLAFLLWATDHENRFPFQVKEALGGTQELSLKDENGFEANPVPIFRVMSNELRTTRILVAPNDATKKPALDFTSLGMNNISYLLRTGAKVSPQNPGEILAIDPINQLVLYCNGSVQRTNQPGPRERTK